MNNSFNVFLIALKNIKKHFGKNMLVGIMVFLTVFVFLFTSSFVDTSTKEWRNFHSNTTVGYVNVTKFKGLKKDYFLNAFELPKTYISDELIDYLEKNNITFSKRVRTGGVQYDFENQKFTGSDMPVAIIGTDIEKEMKSLNNLEIVEGKIDKENANSAVVWKHFAIVYGWKIGDEISFFMNDADENTVPYTFVISGFVYNKTGHNLEVESNHVINPLIFVDYDYLSTMLGVEDGKCVEVDIWTKDKEQIKEIKSIAERNDSEMFYAEGGFGVIESITLFIKFIGNFVAIFLLVILTISTLNIFIMNFLERQKEIGSIIAMGAKTKWVVKLLLFEMFSFSILALVFSLGIYFALSLVFSNGINLGELGMLFAGGNFKFYFNFNAVIYSGIAVFLSIAVSTLYPLMLAIKLNPVEVFREGDK